MGTVWHVDVLTNSGTLKFWNVKIVLHEVLVRTTLEFSKQTEHPQRILISSYLASPIAASRVTEHKPLNVGIQAEEGQ